MHHTNLSSKQQGDITHKCHLRRNQIIQRVLCQFNLFQNLFTGIALAQIVNLISKTEEEIIDADVGKLFPFLVSAGVIVADVMWQGGCGVMPSFRNTYVDAAASLCSHHVWPVNNPVAGV